MSHRALKFRLQLLLLTGDKCLGSGFLRVQRRNLIIQIGRGSRDRAAGGERVGQGGIELGRITLRKIDRPDDARTAAGYLDLQAIYRRTLVAGKGLTLAVAARPPIVP